MRYKVVLAWITSCMTVRMKAIQHYFHMHCFIKHHEVVLKSVDKTLGFYHSNESHREVFYVFHFIIFFKVVLTTNF